MSPLRNIASIWSSDVLKPHRAVRFGVCTVIAVVLSAVPLYFILYPPLVDLPEHILISKLLWETVRGVSELDLEITWFLGYRLFPVLMLVIFSILDLLGLSFV